MKKSYKIKVYDSDGSLMASRVRDFPDYQAAKQFASSLRNQLLGSSYSVSKSPNRFSRNLFWLAVSISVLVVGVIIYTFIQ